MLSPACLCTTQTQTEAACDWQLPSRRLSKRLNASQGGKNDKPKGLPAASLRRSPGHGERPRHNTVGGLPARSRTWVLQRAQLRLCVLKYLAMGHSQEKPSTSRYNGVWARERGSTHVHTGSSLTKYSIPNDGKPTTHSCFQIRAGVGHALPTTR